MKNTLYKGAVVAGLLAAAPFAFAAEGERHEKRGGNLSEEVRTELRAAFESDDYDAYVEITEENDLRRVLSEEQFEAKQEKHEQKQAARAAVLDGDYDEWRSIVGDDRATSVDAGNFGLLTDLAEAREAEDEDAVADAKQALEAAGIKSERKGKKSGERGNRGGNRDISNLSDDQRSSMIERLQNLIAQLQAQLNG